MTPFQSRHLDSEHIKNLSVIGFVSFAAVVHSHIYWVYSIICIAYHKITPNEEDSPAVIRWRLNKSKANISNSKKKVHRHSRKKSLTSKPKPVIMPTIAPTKISLVASDNVDALLYSAPKQHRVPLLHALRTFPSNSGNLNKLINSQRKMPKRNNSTGHVNQNITSLPVLAEIKSRSSEDSYSSGSGTESTNYIGKKGRAYGLIRSTFQRSISADVILQTSNSSLSEEEGVTVIASKNKKRDAIFSLTRKFSSRKPAISEEKETKDITEEIKKHHRAKLFRNLPSWKKSTNK